MDEIYEKKYVIVDNFEEVHKNIIKEYFDKDISKFPLPPKYLISESSTITPLQKNKRFLIENYSDGLLKRLTEELGMINPKKINNLTG